MIDTSASTIDDVVEAVLQVGYARD
jgi:hypothetical protein